MKELEWQLCPVCEGCGIVPNGFYLYPKGQQFNSSSAASETCRSCHKTGMVIKPVEGAIYGKVC